MVPTFRKWAENLRLVTTDGIGQRRGIDRVSAQIARGSPAQTFISDFYRTRQPFTRAQAETVSPRNASCAPFAASLTTRSAFHMFSHALALIDERRLSCACFQRGFAAVRRARPAAVSTNPRCLR